MYTSIWSVGVCFTYQYGGDEDTTSNGFAMGGLSRTS